MNGFTAQSRSTASRRKATQRQLSRVLAIVLSACLGTTLAQHEQHSASNATLVTPPGYRAPTGFGAARWGDSLAQIAARTHGLKLSFVKQAFDQDNASQGLNCHRNNHVVAFNSPEAIQDCIYDGPTQYLTDTPPPRRAGPSALYVFAEYRAAHETPELYASITVTVRYGFCVLHPPQVDTRKHIRFDKKNLRLCAIRLSTTNRSLLYKLIERYGTPPGYTETTVSTLEHYRWCGSHAPRDAYIPCPASIAFAFDAASQQTEVILATPAAYAAFAQLHRKPRRSFRKGPDRYYAFLYEHPLQLLSKNGPYICPNCGPEHYSLSNATRRRFEPEP